MIAILNVPGIKERVSPLSVAEYHQLGEYNKNGRRTELIRGVVIEKIPKSPLHCFIAENLRRLFVAEIPADLTVFSHDPITTIDSEPEPAVMVVLGTPSDFRSAHPTTAELVIEVALSSLEIDRVKALIYAEAGVKEYWIVCPKEKQVEVYRKPTTQGYAERETFAGATFVDCAIMPGVRVDFGALFV